MAEILGRRGERDAVTQLLARARAGHSQVLVVRGEAGIGKSVLLDHALQVATASGFRVQSAAGAESETQFAFAGLHQLCAPLQDHLGALPEPQQIALGVALGQRSGAAPDRFLVALAVLHLLAEVAEEAPLLCLVDDAQWLDPASAQVLAFVARRVAAERMALVFAVRDPSDGDTDSLRDLPELALAGLSETDARKVLTAAVSGPLDELVRDRIVLEARGNPLALLELPRSAPPTKLAGGFELPGAHSVPHRVEVAFEQRASGLPGETQLLLLVAAAEPTGDVALLWRAAEQVGIDRDSATPAEAAGLLEIGTRVRFRHPLVRSAVYRAATAPDQRRAHGALAAVTDPLVDPDRRAWHRGQAVLGTDEDAAAGLERSADRARARGGLAASAAFMKRAVELTPEPAVRAARALEAALTAHEAGAFEAALELLTLAAAGPLDELGGARLALLRAQLGLYITRDSDGLRTLLDGAARLAPLDPPRSRETYLQALDLISLRGGLGDGRGLLDVVEAARAAPPPLGAPGPADLLLDGFVTTHTRGFAAGAPRLHQAVAAYRALALEAENVRDGDPGRLRLPPAGGAGPLEGVLEDGRWPRMALALFDDEAFFLLTDRAVRLARESGALMTLYVVLLLQVVAKALGGRLAHATELADEQAAIARVIGAVPLRQGWLLLAALRGDEAEFAELYEACVREATDHGDFTEASEAHLFQAILQNSLGNYRAALDAAERVVAIGDPWKTTTVLPHLVEAASRADQPERAAAATEEFSARANAMGTQWALGLAARCRALTRVGPDAEGHYLEAIERLSRCRVVIELARAHQVYGEWLRREGRRQEARDQLRTAHQLLSDMGAVAAAERAARELRATGEHPRGRTTQDTDRLTAQELHIARLVATGATSREVASQLFLSPRTIEAHLRNIFRKLGITSRRQLRELRLT